MLSTNTGKSSTDVGEFSTNRGVTFDKYGCDKTIFSTDAGTFRQIRVFFRQFWGYLIGCRYK